MSKNKTLFALFFGYLLGITFGFLFTQHAAFVFPFAHYAQERPSPHAIINTNALVLTPEKVELHVPHVQLVSFADTNSMDPVIDADTKGLLIPLDHPTELNKGDIIVYRYHHHYIVHRIVEIGYDHEGWYVVTKGDNLSKPDPLKVRWNMIHGKIIGLLY